MTKFDDTLWFGQIRTVVAAPSTLIFGLEPDRRLRVTVAGSGENISDFGPVVDATDKMYRFVRWQGANVILNGGRIVTSTGANITTANGDLSLIYGDPSGDFYVFHVPAAISGLSAALASKADLAGATFTGVVTGPTPAAGDDSTKLATTEYVQDEISPVQRPAYKSGYYYVAGDYQVSTGNAAGANTIKVYPFRLERAVTVSELGSRISVLHAANNFQMAIYANNAATSRPTGSELAKTGNLATDAAVAITAAPTGGNITLQAGVIYWAASNNSGATAAFLSANSTANAWMMNVVGAANLTELLACSQMYTTPMTFGTWGDLTSAVWTQVPTALVTVPTLIFKVA